MVLGLASCADTKPQRILIGGVPFGRDNVGDEAILECVVAIVGSINPEAEIWVSTDDRAATEKKLGVKTVPLFGFDAPGFNYDEMSAVIDAVDAFVWAGATGLSDYPEVPLYLLHIAHERKKKTAIFCTGMNAELNPYLYRLLPGKRHKIYNLIRKLSFGSIDLIRQYENKKRQQTIAMMREGINTAQLVILRDQQSLEAMHKLIGVPEASVLIGSDPAIEIVPKPVASSRFSDAIKSICSESNRKIGLCLSAQSPVRQIDDLAGLLSRLIASSGVKIVGIPMNPVTDAELLNAFQNKLEQPNAMCVAEGRYEPDEIAGLASEMDVVISSRLHLLIFASITLTPFIGISRGSKITNFTSQFQLPDIGNVSTINMAGLEDEIIRLFNEHEQFEQIAKVVRAGMLKRLETAKSSLSELLISPKGI